MKFEKINKDKIKVILNSDDLNANDVDFHSFMADSVSTQSLFLSVLEKAEKDYNFSTKNYSLKVETIASSDGNFILTITRVLDDFHNSSIIESSPKKKLNAHRKLQKSDCASVIYKFNTFEDFCNFSLSLNNNSTINYKNISKDSILYNYNNIYYLVLKDINIKQKNLKGLFALTTEFATYVNFSEVIVAKLNESGKIIFKNKAIQNCIKYFVEK